MRAMLRRYLKHQESVLAVTVAWILAPLAGALAFFYLGTIWATKSDLDLRLIDIERGLLWGAMGLLIGMLFAVLVTMIYPKYANRDFADHEDHYDGHLTDV
jgi:hypothetical protein